MLQIASIVRSEKKWIDDIQFIRKKRKIEHQKRCRDCSKNGFSGTWNICIRTRPYLPSKLNINKMESPHIYVDCGSGHLRLTAQH